MACIINSKIKSTPKVVQPVLKTPRTLKLPYEIPERYRNSFYLANAALFDSTNWFLHRAFEVAFPQLKQRLKQTDSSLTNDGIAEKVENIVEVLDQCNSVIDVRFPVKRDSGKYEIVRGFRAHYGLGSGYVGNMGGLRIDDQITRDHMKALSVLSTYRNACMGIGMAGAFGGIKISPKSYSIGELKQIVQRYASELIQKGYCNNRDVLEPDINSGEQEMNWICEAYPNITGRGCKICSVGKKPSLGGVYNYSQSSAYGTHFAIKTFLKDNEITNKLALSPGLKDKTFIIQGGLGKLGKPLTEMLLSEGAICVGVKDHDAYIYDSQGINFQELCEYKTKTGSIKNYGNAKEETNDSIFTEQCDILILAAIQKSLICYTADKVKAKIIVEASNCPVTPTAHKILTCSGKLVLPDIYACSGSTIASYLEYLKNLYQIHGVCDDFLKKSNVIYESSLNNLVDFQQKITADGINNSVGVYNESNILMDTMECILTDVGREVISIAVRNDLGTDVRTAAYVFGINNIFNNIYNEKSLL